MIALVVVVFAIIIFLFIKATQKANAKKHFNTDKGRNGSVPSGPYSTSSIDNAVASSIGKDGEKEVSLVLSSLPQEYLVVNNVIIPDQMTDPERKHTTQIDHIVVSPFGIFVIETKNYKGWIFGSEKSKEWKEVFKTTPEHYFYNPIKQNWGHIYALAEHLQLKTRVFKPIVVFSDGCKLNVETTTPVIYLSQLKGLILSYIAEIIPRKDVARIYDRLNKIILAGEEVENKHIQSIGERFSEKESALRERRCPRCGGKLIMREGKYGVFYGCSNYPKCKFTYNVQS